MAGCACYHFGNDTLYPPDIHTIYVPVIESDSFRRDLGEQLTEAVCKEIEKRTPLKVVGTPNADSVLTARIKIDTKHSLVREPNNEGRVIEMGLVVAVSWADRRGIVLRSPVNVPVPPDLVTLVQTNQLIPEYGALDRIVAAKDDAATRQADRRHDGNAVVNAADDRCFDGWPTRLRRMPAALSVDAR